MTCICYNRNKGDTVPQINTVVVKYSFLPVETLVQDVSKIVTQYIEGVPQYKAVSPITQWGSVDPD